MDKQGQEYQWLEWAKELQFIAQAGLTYTKDLFDKERFERIREISAEIMKVCRNTRCAFFFSLTIKIDSFFLSCDILRISLIYAFATSK